MTPKQALWMLIAGSALIRLICAFSLGLGNDEAYHFLYAAHPALSYYDHPPMMAWVEMAGLTLSATRASAWALRIGFIVLFGGSTWLLARVTTRSYGPWAGFLAAFALNVTGYYGLAAATFALPDGPLLFFWLLTIDRLEVALAEPDSKRLTPWVWVGLAWGGAMLSKYHAVLIPLGTALYRLAPPSDEALAVAAGPVPGVRPRAARVQSGPRLECRPWLGIVLVPGRPRGRELDASSRLPRGGHSGSGRLSVPVDLGIADRHLDQRMPELADDRLGSRAALALPGGRSAGHLHRRGVFSPGLAALGLDRARVALSDPGEQVGRATRKTPRVDSPAARRLRRLFPGDSGALRSASTVMAGCSAMVEAGGDSSIPEPIPRSISTAGTRWPIGSSNSACSTIRARSSSPATGIKAPISPTRWAASSPFSVTTPTIRAGSPSGAGPKNGLVAMGSWSWSVRSSRGRGISGAGSGPSNRSRTSGSNGTASR